MNAGHSSCLFLENNKQCNVISFDIGSHDYVKIGKQYIDNTYPNRHELIIGDSKTTIPLYTNSNKGMKMDLIFIDGGHDYETAKEDLINCKNLSHKDTIIIMDDTTFNKDDVKDYTIGPTRIWNEYLEQNKLTEICRKHYCSGRGMVWGKPRL